MMKYISAIFCVWLAFAASVYGGSYTLTLGKFSQHREAEELYTFLSAKDYPVYLRYGSMYEVRVGSFSSWAKAENLAMDLREKERLIAKIIEDDNLESPLLKRQVDDASDTFIRERRIADYRKQKLIRTALSFIYHPYIYGGQKIGIGIDCSYFTQLVYKNLGIELPRTARLQYLKGAVIERGDLQVGDLLFFRRGKRGMINHVGMYVGNNEFIHATRGVKRVTITNLDSRYYAAHYSGARRILAGL